MRAWNWLERLNATIEAASNEAFDYGSANCALFAADCVDAVLEDSHRGDELRAMFSTAREAVKVLRDVGGIEAAVTERLGPPVAWPRLCRGDIALVETAEGPGLGVCLGHVIACRGAGAELAYVPLHYASKGWRVE